MDFNNTGAMKSPFSPRVRQSIAGRRPIGLSSAKKNQSKFIQSSGEQAGDIIYKTSLITVETHGLPLPVMVTEVLTFGSADVSVRMSSCGWCWVVTGRRILAWPHSLNPDENGQLPAGGLAARELMLPQTDLSHKADLVMVFYANGAQMPSCVGVSPEGVVRFWPSVGQEGVHVDVSCELAGQECERLVTAQGALLLATTTCTLVILSPATVNGRQSVSCRTLRPPSGWLGDIGRRVSLMFFGSMQAPAHAETKLVGVVGVGGDSTEPHIALVAGGPILQLWRGDSLYEHNLRRALTDSHHLVPHGDVSNVEILALDVHACSSGDLLLLIAAVNVARSPEMRYALAHISIADPSQPVVRGVAPLRGWGGPAGGGGPAELEEPPRFLPLDAHALLYTSSCIAIASPIISCEKMEYISVASEGDRILGAAVCGGAPLLFSRKHGVLLLSLGDVRPAPPSVCDSPMGSPCPSDLYDGNLSLFEIDPHEISTMTTDACGKLKTAFLFHLRRDTVQCRELLQQLFPLPPAGQGGVAGEGEAVDVDSVLDRTVMKIATEMLDDIPAGDPRWKQRIGGPATNIALGSSAALQINAQLQDKKRAFTLFLEFLRATGLWQRLGKLTTEGGGCSNTEHALAGLAEQLAAAIALRKLQQGADGQLIDAAIFQVICGENPEVEEDPEVEAGVSSGALSPSDACYRRVSRVGRVLRAVARAHPPRADALAAARHALSALTLLTSVMSEVHKCRSQWQRSPPPPPPLGPRALLPALADLQKRAVTECAHNCTDATLRAQVLEAAGALAAVVLAESAPLARSARTAHRYEAMRQDAIRPFIEEGQLERAAALAEKFRDFELLVEMCVNADDLERLHGYIDKYSDEGMAEVTFAWLCERGGRHAALLLRRFGRVPRLHAWLGAVPPRRALAVLQRLGAGDAAAAAALLAQMADEETSSVGRMTSMGSLAKLCLVASPSEEACSTESEVWRRVERRLALADHHEALPRDLRARYGLAHDSRVLQPEELVQMYVECDSKSLTEYDYKKALDLTDYIQDMELRDDLRLKIWCACILRDEWSACRGDAPRDELQHNMFFRLVDLVQLMGADLELLLPPLEDLETAPALGALLSAPHTHYQLRQAYAAAKGAP